ncbi:hypothetical protein SB780_37775, partial [Burkholderia sp. SIMBA_057]
WMKEQIERLAPKPVLLVVHGAQTGVYPENADKGVTHEGFKDIVAQPPISSAATAIAAVGRLWRSGM